MMNKEFERKLIDLMIEAKESRMPAVHVVLHMLLGCHTNGTQSEFAKWCCRFSPFREGMGFTQFESVEDFPKELDADD